MLLAGVLTKEVGNSGKMNEGLSFYLDEGSTWR